MRKILSTFFLLIFVSIPATAQKNVQWQPIEKITPRASKIIEKSSGSLLARELKDVKEFAMSDADTVIVKFNSGEKGYYGFNSGKFGEYDDELPTEDKELSDSIKRAAEFSEQVNIELKINEIWGSRENAHKLTFDELNTVNNLVQEWKEMAIKNKNCGDIDVLGSKGNRYRYLVENQLWPNMSQDDMITFTNSYLRSSLAMEKDEPSLIDRNNAIQRLVSDVDLSSYKPDFSIVISIREGAPEYYAYLKQMGKIQ